MISTARVLLCGALIAIFLGVGASLLVRGYEWVGMSVVICATFLSFTLGMAYGIGLVHSRFPDE